MTNARKRKLLQQRAAGAHVPRVLGAQAPEGEAVDIPPIEPIFSKYFMAEFIEGDRPNGEDDAWHIFSLLDFCNPALPQGPESKYSFADADEIFMRTLLERLDALQEKMVPGLVAPLVQDGVDIPKDSVTKK